MLQWAAGGSYSSRRVVQPRGEHEGVLTIRRAGAWTQEEPVQAAGTLSEKMDSFSSKSLMEFYAV